MGTVVPVWMTSACIMRGRDGRRGVPAPFGVQPLRGWTATDPGVTLRSGERREFGMRFERLQATRGRAVRVFNERLRDAPEESRPASCVRPSGLIGFPLDAIQVGGRSWSWWANPSVLDRRAGPRQAHRHPGAAGIVTLEPRCAAASSPSRRSRCCRGGRHRATGRGESWASRARPG